MHRPFDWVQTSGSTRPRAGMAALSFRERTGPRRLDLTERQSSGYLTSRRSLSVRFATPASPGRSEKLLSESDSRPARGLEPVRHRFGPQPLSVFWPKTDNSVLIVNASTKTLGRRACRVVRPRASVRALLRRFRGKG